MTFDTRFRQRRRWAPRLLAVAVVVGSATSWVPPVPAAEAQPAGASWTAYVGGLDGVTPIATSTNTPGDFISTGGNDPKYIAITPDATTAYVSNVGRSTVTVLDTASNAVTGTITMPDPGAVASVAIAPDGATAYVTQSPARVYPVDTGTNTAGPAIDLPAGVAPGPLAVTPDGATLYVAEVGFGGGGRVFPIALGATPVVGTPITIANGPLGEIQITPDGATAYVVAETDGAVYPIDTGDNTRGPRIPISGRPFSIDIAPDGRTTYVATSIPGDPVTHAVIPINTADNTVGDPIQIDNPPGGMAITPDGTTLYVGAVDAVFSIDLATSTVSRISIAGSGPEFGIAITPDQAPEAALVVTPPNSPAYFTSPSTVRYGTVASYQWDFGDGTTATTSTPGTSHEYANPGTYTATVTLTSSGGTSTTQVFTGQTLYRNGGPQAMASATVTVPVEVVDGLTTPADADRLARTGTPDATLIVIGATALALGVALTQLTRRRRHTRSSDQ
ncbi:MAG: PKD domain-containing protein [Actinophytocola sp.]|uniref:PKD domain-containing protein n=1 Tax=Actinophytocola sp. TaxID=1872138 RepID=UPI003C795671